MTIAAGAGLVPPQSNRDFAFFYDGLRAGRLCYQVCEGCGTPRWPPMPACGTCGSLAWRVATASGRGRLYSYTVHYYPPIPPFECPHAIGLVELEEGHRFVAGLDGVALDDIRIGMPLAVAFLNMGDGPMLPVFRPAGAAS